MYLRANGQRWVRRGCEAWGAKRRVGGSRNVVRGPVRAWSTGHHVSRRSLGGSRGVQRRAALGVLDQQHLLLDVIADGVPKLELRAEQDRVVVRLIVWVADAKASSKGDSFAHERVVSEDRVADIVTPV